MTDGAKVSDAELANRSKAGDRAAFNDLVGRHKAALYRFVRRSVGDPDDAYDILQETFMSAWLALGRFDAAKSFAVWLRAIARNKCRDQARRLAVRRRVHRMLAWIAGGTDPAAEARHRENEDRDALRLHRLDQAIAALPVFYREPLLLAAVTGLSHQEVAAELRTTAKAVEMRIRRARLKLSESLPDPSGEG